MSVSHVLSTHCENTGIFRALLLITQVICLSELFSPHFKTAKCTRKQFSLLSRNTSVHTDKPLSVHICISHMFAVMYRWGRWCINMSCICMELSNTKDREGGSINHTAQLSINIQQLPEVITVARTKPDQKCYIYTTTTTTTNNNNYHNNLHFILIVHFRFYTK